MVVPLLRSNEKAYVSWVAGLVFIIFESVAIAASDTVVSIGMDAIQGRDRAVRQWTELARYLDAEVPGYKFELRPMGLQQIADAVAAQELDFVFTNTAQYAELAETHGLSRIATLCNLCNATPTTEFGAVIFTRADRVDVNTIEDLRGKSLGAVAENEFGGFQMAWRELLDQGIDPYSNLSALRFIGPTQDKTVLAVRDGIVEAGTVRTGILEDMAQRGIIELSDFKVLGARKTGDFPFVHSTRLYPEWPFAKAAHTPARLAKAVAIALLQLPSEHVAARTAHIDGWTVPLDYGEVRNLLRELQIGPFASGHRHSPAELLHQYRYWLIAGVLVVVFSILHALRVRRLVTQRTRELQASKESLKSKNLALQEGERRYQDLYVNAPDMYATVDVATNKILHCNTALCEATGFSKHELVGRPVLELLTPESHVIGEKALRQFSTTGRLTNIEMRLLCKDGGAIDVALSATAVRDKEGAILRGRSIFSDISKRKRAEEQLAQVADSLAEAQRIAQLGNWDWDIVNNKLYWSDQVYRICGVNPQDFGATYDAFLGCVHPEDRDYVDNEVHHAFKRRKPYSIDHRIIRRDGETRVVHEQAEIYWDESGEPVRMVGTVQDITERRRLEDVAHQQELQLMQANKMTALGTLVAGVAHEINNPNQLVMTNAALVKETCKDGIRILSEYLQGREDVLLGGLTFAEVRESMPMLIGDIIEGARRIQNTISSLKTFVRPSRDVMFADVSLNDAVERSIKLLEYLIRQKTAHFSIALADDLPEIQGDELKLEQIVVNLLVNAIEALPDKSRGLEVVTTYDPQSDHVELQVKDEGVGMAKEEMERVFEPFFTTKQHRGGTGLGMAITHSLVKEHGGTIDYASEAGVGTRARVGFPRHRRDPGVQDSP